MLNSNTSRRVTQGPSPLHSLPPRLLQAHYMAIIDHRDSTSSKPHTLFTDPPTYIEQGSIGPSEPTIVSTPIGLLLDITQNGGSDSPLFRSPTIPERVAGRIFRPLAPRKNFGDDLFHLLLLNCRPQRTACVHVATVITERERMMLALRGPPSQEAPLWLGLVLASSPHPR